MKKITNTHNRQWLVENIIIPLTAILLFIGKEIAVLHHGGISITLKGYLIYVLEVATFFVNFLWVAPLAFTKKRWPIFLARLALLLIVHHILRSWLAYTGSTNSAFVTFVLSADRVMLTLWQLDRPLFLSFLLAVSRSFYKRQLEQQQLRLAFAEEKLERARIESTMAQMQLSPHLLLNGLDHVQSFLEDRVPEVWNAINLMATMLNNSLVDIKKVEKVSLAQAIEQVHTRVAFEQLLFDNKLSILVDANISDAFNNFFLPPSLLMPPVENLLKYGRLTDPDLPATIQIVLENNVLRFITQNSMKGHTLPGTGIGLASMHLILNYYYPGRHSLVMTQDKETFILDLTIEL